MQNYENSQYKLRTLIEAFKKDGLKSEELKNYQITVKNLDFISAQNKYDILTDYNFAANYDNYFIAHLGAFPEEFFTFLKLVPIFKVMQPYADFLTYNQYRILDLKAELPDEYFVLTQKCVWGIESITENNVTKYYLFGYILGDLSNQDFDTMPLRGDLYIYIDTPGDRK